MEESIEETLFRACAREQGLDLTVSHRNCRGAKEGEPVFLYANTQKAWKLWQQARGTAAAPEHTTDLHVGWEGYYTRIGGKRWYWCRIVAFDRGWPVIRTSKDHYHARPLHVYQYHTNQPGERVGP